MRSLRKNKLKFGLIAANVVVILGLAGATAYYYFENQDLNEQLTLTTEQKNQRLIEEVNRVYDLPETDLSSGNPVIGQVNNVDDFKGEFPSFEDVDVQVGDYLLAYRKARLNVLYRQTEKRVVKTVNVFVPISIELIGEEADIDAAAVKLAEFGNQVTLIRTVTPGISQSFVFDVDADQEAEAQSIAQQLGFDIGSTLPSTITPGSQTEIIVAVSNIPVPEADAEAETAEQPDADTAQEEAAP